MRKKVALVTSGFGTRYGGVGVVAEAIRSALQPEYSVSVWRHPPSWPRAGRIVRVAAQSFIGSRAHPVLVIYDHVHLAALHAAIPGLRRIPYAVFLHGVEVWESLTGRRREAVLGADLLIANSARTVADALRFNPWLPKVEVVWLGSGTPQSATTARRQPIALMVGRMSSSERYKGHDAVISAWPILRAAVPDARLVVVGTGDDERRLRRRVEDSGLAGIDFCGRLSDSERDRAYRSARLLFYPSAREGFGLAAIEALSFGVPVVGLAGTVTEELFPKREGVVLARDLSPDSIAEAAIPLLRDSHLADQLGQLGRERVEAMFLKEHFARRFRQALAPLLDGELKCENGLTSTD
ncbi:MAG: glycosyltransferase family 4 protein [Acidobacteriia bacterium]|nr:glycosyltransferase family 4 protein [Terriglobia bacterium]